MKKSLKRAIMNISRLKTLKRKNSSVKKTVVGKKVRNWQNNSSLFTDEYFLPGYLKTLIEFKKP